MNRVLLCLSVALLACIAWASPASAAHVGCGDVITQDTTLDSDLVNCPGDGVVIGADNVTLDLAGHTIDGGAVGESYQGVDNDEGHDGVQVRNGRIQDFQAGIYFDHGDDGRVRGVTARDNGAGFYAFDSDANGIERNDLETIALYADSDLNTIDRNRSSSPGTQVLIVGFAQTGGSPGQPPPTLREADGNRITRNHLSGAGESFGIVVSVVNDTVIEGNHVLDHTGTGISMNATGINNRIARNVVSNTAQGIALDGFHRNTVVVDNDVARSDGDGIRIGSMTIDTVVARNTASSNGDDGIDSDKASSTLTKNTANFNADFGIEAVPGVTDGGGNKARGNGNAAQCAGVSCR